MTEAEAVQLAQEYLNSYRISSVKFRHAVLVPEMEVHSAQGFPGANWYVYYSLPPLPAIYQYIDNDPVIVLIINIQNRQVRRIPGV